MAEFFMSAQLSDGVTLCVAPLSSRRIEQSGQTIEDQSGYFLYERRLRGNAEVVRIMAQVIDEDAALRLGELLRLS